MGIPHAAFNEVVEERDRVAEERDRLRAEAAELRAKLSQAEHHRDVAERHERELRVMLTATTASLRNLVISAGEGGARGRAIDLLPRQFVKDAEAAIAKVKTMMEGDT